ncbi:alpha/beta hydrolase [Pseudoteredinibacter isoporae]|uniref:alpha/beta hydrolase n=1 Tax=Pseudoteredinibacter isoporae TaxID=570281 RepID=UPI003105C734
MPQLLQRCCAVISLLICQFALSQNLEPIYDVQVDRDIEYGLGDIEGGQKSLLLDLYRPVETAFTIKQRPAVLLIHGGSFQTGSKENATLVAMARDLAARGYVAASINYRLQGDNPLPSSRVSHIPTETGVIAPVAQQIAAQAAFEDALTALEWLVSVSERYRISDIGIIGSSAGAITAINVAYLTDDFSVESPQKHRISFVVDFWGGVLLPFGNPAEAVNSVEAGEAPMFIVHGSSDVIVAFNYSVLLDRRAKEVGLDHEYHVIQGGGHGFGAIDPFTVTVTGGQSIANAMYDWIYQISQHSFGQQSVGSWYEPATSGQGLLLDLDDRNKQLFGAWFTYNNEAGSDSGQIPGAEQRWFTAQGKYSGRRAVLDLYQSRNGRFDANNSVNTTKVGTLEVDLDSCKKGLARYDMPSLGLSGEINIVRLMSNSSCP